VSRGAILTHGRKRIATRASLSHQRFWYSTWLDWAAAEMKSSATDIYAREVFSTCRSLKTEHLWLIWSLVGNKVVVDEIRVKQVSNDQNY
jgi:hypothetical protein